MNILQVNKFHQSWGGANRYYMELSRILEERGNRVISFSMKEDSNEPSRYSDYFVEHIDLNNPDGLLSRIRCFLRVTYSLDARKKIRKLIGDHRPEIAHIHNIYHQISPSILPVLKNSGIPVVMTAHDYKLVCPNNTLFDGSNICEKCLGGKSYQVMLNRCHNSSFSKGLTLAIEAYLHSLLRSYTECVDTIITPSSFMRNIFITFGVNPDKIVFIPNFVDPIPDKFGDEEDDYILYFGRLSIEKGLRTLISAMQRYPGTRLILAGDGPEREGLEKLSGVLNLTNVQFIGQKNSQETEQLVKNSMFTVITSIWYENCPLSVLESMAQGKPVIGSRIGGIPDLIEDGKDGLLFNSNDVEDLCEKIGTILDDSDYRRELGRNAYLKVKQHFNSEVHYQGISSVYKELIGG